MSYITLYKVPEIGSVVKYTTVGNSWLGAFNIWSEMSLGYLNRQINMLHLSKMQDVWDLCKSENVPYLDRLVMASTLDYAMVKVENIPTLLLAMEGFCERFKPGNLPDQIVSLREIYSDGDCFAVCWQQTSVSQSLWEGYDFSKDTRHWFLFEEVVE